MNVDKNVTPNLRKVSISTPPEKIDRTFKIIEIRKLKFGIAFNFVNNGRLQIVLILGKNDKLRNNFCLSQVVFDYEIWAENPWTPKN